MVGERISARRVCPLFALAALAFLATGCGGSPSGSHVAQLASTTSPSHGGSSSNTSVAPTQASGALAFSRCMRSHGVTEFPDPNNRGVLPKSQLEQIAASNPHFQPAQAACAKLLPNGPVPPGGQLNQTGLQKMERDALNFSRCMRSHGVPDWPDYTLRGGIPIFDLHGTTIDPNAPPVVAKQAACESTLHLSYSPPTSGGART